MNNLNRFIRKGRARLRRMSRPDGRPYGRNARIASALLALAVVCGGVWLTWSAGRTHYVAVLDEPLAPAQLLEAQRLLDSRGISHRTSSGRLMVPENSLPQVRSLLDYEGLMGQSGLTVADLVGESDIWSTIAENDKRTRARRMALLSRLISNFLEVRSATVLYDPGRKRTLGTVAVKPTAAVNVSLHTGAKMTPKLLAAIADQVSGCIAGMGRKDVRIIDEGGRSYYALGEPIVTDAALDQLRAAEVHYARKVEAALAYMGDVIVAVDVEQTKTGTSCRGTSVVVPRSYIVAVAAVTWSNPTDEQIEATAGEQLARIRQLVMRVIGASESDVNVDWYHDMLVPAATIAPAVPAETNSAKAAFCGALVAAGLLAGFAVMLRRRSRRTGRQMQRGAETIAAGRAGPQRPFGFLEDIANDHIARLLSSEHPQTIAVVLGHLRPAKAAAVLAELPPPQQVDATRRLADLDQVDKQVIGEIEQALAERAGEFSGSAGATFGGVGRIAEILQHAGHDTETAVLQGLTRKGQNDLAESIHRKLLAFEDIGKLPTSRLREALGLLESDELAIALRTAGDDLKKKVLAALHGPAARQVRREMDSIGPVRLSDVEAAQQRVAEVVRRFETGTYITHVRQGSEAIA